ncbi:DEAD/DEAH box helicase [Peredibacter starrii]|uniref:DEAD/DEAH box helicase n=1 Tax=Peredibacter starrii TaxID=28202 RepID=A0AAX4HJY4_9BACT|nr:DEAD/DEAH box helicase [Peredibacter starrii]WPU63554.1 DEAD/DEAH box helicase [Peredibacter starrii]
MYKLRPYQQEAVDNTIKYFQKKRDPALIVLPTGAGKSLVIAEMARIARGRVMVLAHVKELVEQNYLKYTSYGLEAGIFSASLGKKDWDQKAIFGSVQSVARAPEEFFQGFSLLVIDECHRVAEDGDTQYQEVIEQLRKNNPNICILGLTATPYRLGLGWIYEYSHTGELKTEQQRFFKQCLYELPLSYMIKNKFLTPPVKVDIPVTCYDFSELSDKNRMYTQSEVEELLKNQKRLTPLIVKNIIDITERFNRQGVMIFSASVKHAEEILSYLPEGEARLVVGDTEISERDEIVQEFKDKKFKYLVNVSVLTTGFDAPHVDVIAILRPTESNSLYQQIVGRGLRLEPGKTDCFILDYTGMGHDIYTPEISDKRPAKESVPVFVPCPKCGFENTFWGLTDYDGDIIEHYGRKCRGAEHDVATLKVTPCGYRFRYKLCHACGTENDVTARACEKCDATLIDADSKLKQAKLSKNAHVLTPDKITFEERLDKNSNPYLEVRYYDADAKYLSEAHFFSNQSSFKKFQINFLRSHLRRPELSTAMTTPQDVIKYQKLLRLPSFVIARKQDKFWKITEKVFAEEL